MDTYSLVVQMIYLSCILGVTVWGVVQIGLDWRIAKVYLQREHLRVWVPLAGFLAGAILLGGLAVGIGELDALMFLNILILSAGLSFVAGAAVYPAAVQLDRPRWKERFRPFTIIPYIFLVLTALWSVVSLGVIPVILSQVVGYEVELKIIEGGMVDLFDTARPVRFLAFVLFALAAAVVEEIIFRGGLQGMLERTRLGAPGAIVVAAFLWALGHGNAYVEPHGIKEFQIFGLGIIFGIVKYRYGLKPAILLHLLNNGGALIIQSFAPTEL